MRTQHFLYGAGTNWAHLMAGASHCDMHSSDGSRVVQVSSIAGPTPPVPPTCGAVDLCGSLHYGVRARTTAPTGDAHPGTRGRALIGERSERPPPNVCRPMWVLTSSGRRTGELESKKLLRSLIHLGHDASRLFPTFTGPAEPAREHQWAGVRPQ